MGFSTFSGPIRSGTERYGAGRNTGVVVLTQAKTIDMAGVALTSSPPVQDLFTLPAGSKIISIIADKTVALSGNSISQVAAIVGNASDDNQYLESVNLAVAKGRAAQATVDAGLQVDDCENIGTSDVLLQATFTATTGNATAGQIVVTVIYAQRAQDGAANPAQA
jgi:hypothetical protein